MDKLDRMGAGTLAANHIIAAKDARIAELEARIRALETVTDEDVERAAYLWFLQDHEPEEWGDNWRAQYERDARAVLSTRGDQ